MNTAAQPKARFLRTIAALLMGLMVGLFFHYLLYRLSVPAKPFIYAAF